MTVRDALNVAMEEEMIRDDNVFILGEEVARYNGAYKVRFRHFISFLSSDPHTIPARSRKAFWTSLARSESSTHPSPRWASPVSPLAPPSQVSDPCPSVRASSHPLSLCSPSFSPRCEFMTFNFAMQAIDQIVNSAGKTYYMSGGNVPCPVVFRGPNGAAAGVGAQHSQDYASWYGQIPGLKVVSPWSAEDCKGLLKVPPALFLS